MSQTNQVVEDGGATVVQRERPRWHANVPGLSGLSMGLALVGVGVYMFITAATYSGALLSVLTIGFGIVVVAITRDVVENRRFSAGRNGIRYGRYGTTRYVRNERDVEDEEDRKRASGEAD